MVNIQFVHQIAVHNHKDKFRIPTQIQIGYLSINSLKIFQLTIISQIQLRYISTIAIQVREFCIMADIDRGDLTI